MTPITVEGTTAEGFESIRSLFEQNMHRYLENKAQLCIYVDDRCVSIYGLARRMMSPLMVML